MAAITAFNVTQNSVIGSRTFPLTTIPDDYVYELTDTELAGLNDNDIIEFTPDQLIRAYRMFQTPFLVMPGTAVLPSAVETPFPYSANRATWNTNQLNNFGELQSALQNAQANTIIFMPPGDRSETGITIDWVPTNNIFLVPHESNPTRFINPNGQRLFTIRGSCGENSGLMIDLIEWARSGNNTDAIQFDSFQTPGFNQPFRITNSSFGNVGSSDMGSDDGLACVSWTGRPATRNVWIDHSDFVGIKRDGARIDVQSADVPPLLAAYSNNETWRTRPLNAQELDYDENVFGVSYDCGVAHCLFDSPGAPVPNVSSGGGDNFAAGSIYIDTRMVVSHCRFRNGASDEIIQHKSSGNIVQFIEFDSCRSAVSVRNGDNNSWRYLYAHGAQDNGIGPIAGVGNIVQDYVLHSNRQNDTGAGRVRYPRGGIRGNGTLIFPLKDNILRNFTLVNETGGVTRGAFQIGLIDEFAGSFDLTDAQIATDRHQVAVENLLLENIDILVNNGDAVNFQIGDYAQGGRNFTFPDLNDVTCSGLRVWTNGSANAGNAAALQSDFQLNQGAEPDHTMLGPQTIGSFAAGKMVA